MPSIIKTKTLRLPESGRAFIGGMCTTLALVVAVALCVGLTVRLQPESWSASMITFAACAPIMLAHWWVQSRLRPPPSADPSLARGYGRCASLLALALVAFLFTTPDAQAQSADTIKLGDLTISDGVVDTGDMIIGNGCVKFANGDQIGDCGDSEPGEPGAEPPGKTLDDALDDCDGLLPESTTSEETTTEQTTTDAAEPISEDCDKLEEELPDETAPNTSPEADPEPTDDGTMPDETAAPEENQPMADDETSSDWYEQYLAQSGDEACVLPDDVDDLRRVTVERVVDGDTLEMDPAIDGMDTVRLIGVDTPETVDPDTETEHYGPEAAEHTQLRLEGAKLFLEVGEEPQDDYERLLAHAWTADASLFSEELLAGGYGTLLTIEPNDKYSECLTRAEEYARTSGLGLWADEDQDPEDRTPEAPESTDETPSQPTSFGTDDRPTEPQAASDEQPEPAEVPETTDEQTPNPETTTLEQTIPEATIQEQTTPETSTPQEPTPERTTSETFGAPEEAPPAEQPQSAPPTPDEPTTSTGGFGIAEDVQQPVIDTLPTQSTPEGEEPVLPDTSGPFGLTYIAYYLIGVLVNLAMITTLYLRDRRVPAEHQDLGN